MSILLKEIHRFYGYDTAEPDTMDEWNGFVAGKDNEFRQCGINQPADWFDELRYDDPKKFQKLIGMGPKEPHTNKKTHLKDKAIANIYLWHNEFKVDAELLADVFETDTRTIRLIAGGHIYKNLSGAKGESKD